MAGLCRELIERQENDYTRSMVIGVGLCVTGVLNLLGSSLWWLPMLLGFAAGLTVMHLAQKRYNGSWFS